MKLPLVQIFKLVITIKSKQFKSNKTIIDYVWDQYPTMNEKDIRAILGRFLFVQDDVKKVINDLSGGEKARLQLALLMLQRDNVLILDEPTNHLDIDSKEMLEQALKDFEGTILLCHTIVTLLINWQIKYST